MKSDVLARIQISAPPLYSVSRKLHFCDFVCPDSCGVTVTQLNAGTNNQRENQTNAIAHTDI
jgi:hypothetical protein